MDNYNRQISEVPVLMLNFPRCGSNFLNYCIEQIIGKRIWKHHGQSYPFWQKEVLPTIVIVRNYKECIPRQDGSYSKYDLNIIKTYLQNNRPTDGDANNVFDYISILKHYDTLDDDKRLMIYYEDLLTNPKEELTKVIEFFESLNIPCNDVTEFFNNFESHSNASLGEYPATQSRGKDLLFHSKNMDLNVKQEVDNYIKNNYEILWNRYLNRYGED